MINELRQSLWRQFGAGINMLMNVLSNCPDNYFETNKRFYYLAYHSVIFLDYYLTIPPEDFRPKLSFTIRDKDQRPPDSSGDMIPDKHYSREELLEYVRHCSAKCRLLIEKLTEYKLLHSRFTEGDQAGDMDYPLLEILLYNLRHTQHHTGQLNLMIRQDLGEHMDWIFRIDD